MAIRFALAQFPGAWASAPARASRASTVSSTDTTNAGRLALAMGEWHGKPLLPCGLWNVTSALAERAERLQPLIGDVPLSADDATLWRAGGTLRTVVCAGSQAAVALCTQRHTKRALTDTGDEAAAKPVVLALGKARSLGNLLLHHGRAGVLVDLSGDADEPHWTKQTVVGLFESAGLCRISQLHLRCGGLLVGECRMLLSALRGTGVAAFAVE